MTNICFVIHNLLCGGGTERVGVKVANELCQRGYGVTMISYDAHSNESYFELDPRIETGVMLGGFVERRTRPWRWYASMKLRRWLLKHKVDVVVDIDTYHALWTWPAIKGTGIKWISWDHFNINYALREPLRVKALQLVRDHADRLVLLSKEDKKSYLEKTDIPAAKIVQLYNPLSFEEKEWQPRRAKKVIAIGRISEQKGFDLLLQSWQKVEREIDDWELEIVCGFGDHVALHREAEAMGLRRVSCCGPTKDVRGKLVGSGIYALSSRFEGFGLVLTEAATMGVPAVAYNCPVGPSEIITDGVDGLLVEPENTEQFADKLLWLMRHDDERMAMSRHAFESAKRFSTEVVIPQWVELIEEVMKK